MVIRKNLTIDRIMDKIQRSYENLKISVWDESQSVSSEGFRTLPPVAFFIYEG